MWVADVVGVRVTSLKSPMSSRLSALSHDDGRVSLDVSLGEIDDYAPEEDLADRLHRFCASGDAAAMYDFLQELDEGDVDEQDLDEGLTLASHHGHVDCVKMLLHCGANAKWHAPDGGTRARSGAAG